MPEAEYTTASPLSLQEIWSFVQDMDNWARFVRGYQSHEKQSETDSTWVLKGDIGVMARRLEFRVHITEWRGPNRVCFELTGLNEPMTGAGSFEMQPWEGEGAAAPSAAAPRKGRLLRLFEAVVRAVLRLFGGAAARSGAAAGGGAGGPASRLTFRLRIDPGGPMAPMVSALMKPVMLPAAEDLANQIMARVEELHRAGR